MQRALEEFTASRAREGDKLKDLLLERVKRMEELVEKVKPRIPQLVLAYQERLATRLKDALKDISVAVDEDRIRRRWRCSPPRSTWRKSCLGW